MDSKLGTVHSVCTTAASVADKHMLPHLLHGEERKVWSDGGYQGQTEAIRQAAPKARDMTCRRTRFKQYVDQLQRKKNRTKVSCGRLIWNEVSAVDKAVRSLRRAWPQVIDRRNATIDDGDANFSSAKTLCERPGCIDRLRRKLWARSSGRDLLTRSNGAVQ